MRQKMTPLDAMIILHEYKHITYKSKAAEQTTWRNDADMSFVWEASRYR